MSLQGRDVVLSTRRFSAKDLEIIEKSENNQRQFRQWIVASKGFSEPEKAAIKINTVKEFSTVWEQANNEKGSFGSSHEKGYGLWSKKYQSSAAVVQGFMMEFSPIINIVQNFAAPYGGIAVGIMSVLFTVASNKDRMEDRLTSVISAIRDLLPGLKLYQHIYNENDELDISLQEKIVSAYESFFDFCIVATKYYKSGGPRRWLRALGMSSNYTAEATKVQDVIVDIRRLCDELLDKNVDTIKKMGIDHKRHIKDLEAQIRRLQEGHDGNRLLDIQRLFKLDVLQDDLENTRNGELEKYRHALDSDYNLNAPYFQQMRGQGLDLFKCSKDYQSWIKSEGPSLLILSGYNNISISGIDQCWLSPVAIAMIEDLEKPGSRPIHAYCVLPQRGKLLYDFLPVIFLQLLRQKQHALRDDKNFAELCVELLVLQKWEQSSKDTEPEDERISALHRVALRVMDVFDESEIVYIIVDRADRCRDGIKIDHRKALLRAFVKMVEAARSKLRILVVIHGNSWPMEKHQDELGEKMNDRVIIHTANQHYC